MKRIISIINNRKKIMFHLSNILDLLICFPYYFPKYIRKGMNSPGTGFIDALKTIGLTYVICIIIDYESILKYLGFEYTYLKYLEEKE